MLSAVQFVDKDKVERDIEAEKKDRRREKKKEKKERRKEEKQRRKAEKARANETGPESPPESDSEASDHGAAEAPEKQQDTVAARKPSVEREDWMTKAMPKATPGAAQEGAEQLKEEPAKKAAELNPYLKNGGDGYPDEEGKRRAGHSGIIPTAKVGDGGASWRLKALKRAQTAAEEEGRSVNEIVSERFNSLKDLTASLSDRRAAHSMAHAHAAKDRRGDEPRKPRGAGAEGTASDGKAAYLADVKSSSSQMKRPSAGASLSWRKERGKRDTGGPSESRDQAATNGRHKDRGPRGAGRQADAAALAAAAASLNTFKGDGSFMESFQQRAEPAAEPPQEGAAAEGGLRPDQMAMLDEASDEEMLEGGGIVLKDAAPSHISSVSETGAKAGNHAAAAALRARLHGDPTEPSGGGNFGAAAALRAKLQGRVAPARSAASKRETVVLPQVDAGGRAMPGAFGREAAGTGALDGGRKPKRVQRYDEPGEKTRYFADDDGQDLESLVKRQRYEGAEDIDANLAENIARKSTYKGNELDVDEEYDNDGTLAMYESRAKKGDKEQQVKREKARQVSDYRRATNALESCPWCFSNKGRPKHLTVSIGQTAYLMLPPKGRLVPGHCLIVPAEHVASTRQVDEHVWTEIRNFKKCLLQMFMAQGKDVIFMETAKRLQDTRRHATVECIPVPPKVASKAPLYFKKSIDDAEDEWAQHHAKRWIDTSAKGLRSCIPPNFPYFAAEIGLSSGHVHVIDDEDSFPDDFGRGVLVGLLQLPAEQMHKRAKQESHSIQEQWVSEFAAQWDDYDWTKQLA